MGHGVPVVDEAVEGDGVDQGLVGEEGGELEGGRKGREGGREGAKKRKRRYE
jgi:hypothetical protein